MSSVTKARRHLQIVTCSLHSPWHCQLYSIIDDLSIKHTIKQSSRNRRVTVSSVTKASRHVQIVTCSLHSTWHCQLYSIIDDLSIKHSRKRPSRNRRVTVCFNGEAEAYWPRRKAHLARHVKIAKCAAPMVVAEALFQIYGGPGGRTQRPQLGRGDWSPHRRKHQVNAQITMGK